MDAIEIGLRLALPFPPGAVSWRVGATTKDKAKGMALAYIDARDVMARLDDAVGPANWQRRYPWSDDKRLCCEVGIKIEGEWVWKADGAGDSDVEAEKGAFSDAFKRAAVSWGVGRYLYDLDTPWVALEAKGNSQIIPESEMAKLRSLLTRNAAQAGKPATATPPAPKPAPAAQHAPAQPQPPTDWQIWLTDFKAEFTAAPTYLAATDIMRRETKTLMAYREAHHEAGDKLRAWCVTTRDAKPKDAG